MSLSLRIIMIVGAILVFWVIAKRVRKNKVMMADAIFWVVLGVVLLLAAAFPDAIIWVAGVLGFQSPANFVFLLAIGLLLMKVFSNATEISLLRFKLQELTQELALYQDEQAEKEAARKAAARRRAAARKAAAQEGVGAPTAPASSAAPAPAEAPAPAPAAEERRDV